MHAGVVAPLLFTAARSIGQPGGGNDDDNRLVVTVAVGTPRRRHAARSRVDGATRRATRNETQRDGSRGYTSTREHAARPLSRGVRGRQRAAVQLAALRVVLPPLSFLFALLVSCLGLVFLLWL